MTPPAPERYAHRRRVALSLMVILAMYAGLVWLWEAARGALVTGVIAAVGVALATATIAAVRSASAARPPRPKDKVAFDDTRVVVHRADGGTESVDWKDLVEVGIVTTDEGPWLDDVLWRLVPADGKTGCVVPSEAEGMPALLERLQQLPGFDNEALARAMGCTSNAAFVCWKRRR